MISGEDLISQMDHDRVEVLYHDLRGAFPHPFDWMGLLEKPPFWRWTWRKPHNKVTGIFAAHGFCLNRTVALRFMLSEGQGILEDAGGSICRQLRYALRDQLYLREG